MLSRRELALLDPRSWDDRNDRYFMARYKEAKKLKSVYGRCAARCSETYHHWRVFTDGKDGVCAEIKREPLENVLKTNGNIRFRDVEYLILDQLDKLGSADINRLPFLKRAGFEPELEYRIVATSPDPQASVLGISLELSWISTVYLNPWMPEAVAQSVKSTLRQIPGCSKLKIVRSFLIDNERWKRAGDRIAGKVRSPAHKRLSLRKPGISKTGR